MRPLTTALTIAALALSLRPAPAVAVSGPTQALRRTNSKINRLLRKKVSKGTRQEARVKRKLTREVNRFLDFRELARLALARHWRKRTSAERREFVDILRRLIEANYIRQLRSNVNYRIEYRNESVNGNQAKVTTAIKVKKDGRTSEIVIEYKMRRAKGRWVVYDVITDDVSIVRNYRSQFNRIIRKQSYRALVDKMRRKLKKIQG